MFDSQENNEIRKKISGAQSSLVVRYLSLFIDLLTRHASHFGTYNSTESALGQLQLSSVESRDKSCIIDLLGGRLPVKQGNKLPQGMSI